MIRPKWMVATKKADFFAVGEKYNIDPVIARIIRNRDVISDDDIEMFLGDNMNYLHDPYLMKDMELAKKVLLEDIENKKRIRIIGDYDVDGICATYILLQGLKTLGALVDTVIPHRMKDGYGLNESLIEEAHNDGIDTILTCDNGIAAFSQIELAKSYGMTVIVTDHHEVPYELDNDIKKYIIPNADAIVDPKQEDCNYPFKGICGALVAYKLVSILLSECDNEVLDSLLPFAAMATVCDVMELLDENRIVVKNGIKKMMNPQNVGLKALLLATGLSDKEISAYHFGFVLGPTINATGRLDTAKRALELFSCEDFNEACQIATELRQLNEMRKSITEDGVIKASSIIEEEGMSEDRVLVVYLPEVHESVAGIIAGRLKEKYYKPVIVLTDAEEGIKGSGRSIDTYNMYEELTKVNDLFSKYGGHKMAAGLSLNSCEDVSSLRKRLNDNCSLSNEDIQRVLHIDVPMPFSYINYKLIDSLSLLEPCGTANPKPLFADKNISLLSYQKRGRTKVIGKFRVLDENDRTYDMVYFDDLEEFDNYLLESFGEEKFQRLSNGGCRKNEIVLKIAYNPSINEYNGNRSIQIVMKDYCV